MEEEKTIDIKGTLDQFLNTPAPELPQEEAIRKYQEPITAKRRSGGGDATDTSEEDEHLKRVKAELLASLERVKKLEQQLYGQKEKSNEKIKQSLKASGGSQGKGSQQVERPIEVEERQQKERE